MLSVYSLCNNNKMMNDKYLRLLKLVGKYYNFSSAIFFILISAIFIAKEIILLLLLQVYVNKNRNGDILSALGKYG